MCRADHFIHHVTGTINHKDLDICVQLPVALSIHGHTNAVRMLTERGTDRAPRTFSGRLHYICPHDTMGNGKLFEYSSYSSSAARYTVQGGFLPHRTLKATATSRSSVLKQPQNQLLDPSRPLTTTVLLDHPFSSYLISILSPGLSHCPLISLIPSTIPHYTIDPRTSCPDRRVTLLMHKPLQRHHAAHTYCSKCGGPFACRPFCCLASFLVRNTCHLAYRYSYIAWSL